MSASKMVALEGCRLGLSENVSFGIGIICVTELSSSKSRSGGMTFIRAITVSIVDDNARPSFLSN